MKPASKAPLRALLLLAAVVLVAVVFFWHNNRTGQEVRSRGNSNATTPQTSDRRIKPARESNLEADRLLVAEGARTDVSASRFPLQDYQLQASPAGKPEGAPVGAAYIHVPSVGQRIAIEPNQLGEFPAVDTSLEDMVGVRILLDAVQPGTPVRVVILDGGSFPTAEGVSQVLPAADWQGVAFEFTTSANIGTHRVLVQAAGQKSRILDFTAQQ